MKNIAGVDCRKNTDWIMGIVGSILVIQYKHKLLLKVRGSKDIVTGIFPDTYQHRL